MKKVLLLLTLILLGFSSFAQFEAGEYINSDTVKIDGVPLLLNTFKQGNLGGASNIFYSTGASSQPASGSVNQVMGGGLLTDKYLPKWDGSKFVNTVITEVNGKIGINRQNPSFFDISTEYNGTIAATKLRLQDSYLDNGFYGVQLRAYDNGVDGHDFVIEGRNSAVGSFTSYFYMKNSGFFGINTTLPFERLDVNGNLIADILKSRIATGTPPLVVASSTKVDSLNVEFLDGKRASDFQLAGNYQEDSDTLTFDATLSDLADSSAAIRALANTKAVVSGTDNYIMKKTGANTLGNSTLIDNTVLVSTTLPFSAASLKAGTSEYNNGGAEIGAGRTGNNYAYFDLVGDSTYSDFGDRFIRGNTGANAVSNIYHRGKGEFRLFTVESAPIQFYTKSLLAVTFDTLQNSGFGTLTPAARVHSQSTGTQARLGYDANKYTDLSTGSTGDLTIEPTGDTVKVVGAVNSTGGFFKNGVEITGGGGISNIGIQVPTGLTVNPTSLTANGTFTISYQPGYTYFTDTERLNYSNAYAYRLTGASGTSPLTLSLSANHLTGSLSSQLTSIGTLANSEGLLYNNGSGSFSYKTAPSGTIVGTSDSQALTNKSVNGVTLSTGAGATNFLAGDGTYKAVSGTSQWTSDTYGINYQSGNVGIGTASHSTSKLYVNGSITNNGSDRAALDLTWSNGESTIVSYNTGGGDGLYANSNGVGVRGISSTTFGGVFEGLGCKATKYYVSSLNTAPASSTDTGTTGEIRFTADYIYVCVATNTWKRTQISTW